MNGILLVDKPVGWTSFDVVAKVRNLLKESGKSIYEVKKGQSPKKLRVGHTGTLDPLASGILVLLIGNYTKCADEFTKLDKTYEVEMKLGEISTTGDEEGNKQLVSKQIPSGQSVIAALKSFQGQIDQTPPKYSAIKINGQRAYKLARAGKDVQMQPRKITIYKLEPTNYSFPIVKFKAEVSSGTYIRSLVEDIGQKLGVGAYMSALRRTQVGAYNLSQALKITDITLDFQSITTNLLTNTQ